MNDTNASTTENADFGGSYQNAIDGTQQRDRSTSPMAATGNGTLPIRLNGIYKHITPVVATQ